MFEGGTEVADTRAVGSRHKDVVGVATDHRTQRAVGAEAAAGEVLPVAGGSDRVAHCIGAGGPGHLRSGSATHQLAGYIIGRTGLWGGKQIKPHSQVFTNDTCVELSLAVSAMSPVFKETVSLS